MKGSEDINDEDIKNGQPEQNENMNLETGSVCQNKRINLIENGTAVDTRDTEMTTNETVDIVDNNVRKKMN